MPHTLAHGRLAHPQQSASQIERSCGPDIQFARAHSEDRFFRTYQGIMTKLFVGISLRYFMLRSGPFSSITSEITKEDS